MPKKKSDTLVNGILSFLAKSSDNLSKPLETPYGWISQVGGIPYKRYYDTVYSLKRRGCVRISKEGKKTRIALTPKGRLETLLSKAGMDKPGRWDEKWHLIFFDIPEHARSERYKLRQLLKKNGFHALQASVYVSPHPLNQAAIEYLEQVGYMKHIRILRADRVDNDSDLRKMYHMGY